MEKKQTAVQWLIDKIENDSITPDQIEKQWFFIREAALKLERLQIEEAVVVGMRNFNCFEDELPEQYYQETFTS